MTQPIDWPQRETLVRTRLSALSYLLGEWRGEGLSHGRPTTGRLVARAILEDTVIEVREALSTRDDDGTVSAYDDLALYRFDTESRQLKVTHYQAPATVTDREVLPLPDGGHEWAASPLTPRVLLRPQDDTLQIEVWLPFHPQPDVVMTYRRA